MSGDYQYPVSIKEVIGERVNPNDQQSPLKNVVYIDVAWGKPLQGFKARPYHEFYYGYFEIYYEEEDGLLSGGLWYTRDIRTGELELYDYDGVYALPKKVKEILTQFKFKMDDTF